MGCRDRQRSKTLEEVWDDEKEQGGFQHGAWVGVWGAHLKACLATALRPAGAESSSLPTSVAMRGEALAGFWNRSSNWTTTASKSKSWRWGLERCQFAGGRRVLEKKRRMGGREGDAGGGGGQRE